jgi:hypothetical protein
MAACFRCGRLTADKLIGGIDAPAGRSPRIHDQHETQASNVPIEGLYAKYAIGPDSSGACRVGRLSRLLACGRVSSRPLVGGPMENHAEIIRCRAPQVGSSSTVPSLSGALRPPKVALGSLPVIALRPGQSPVEGAMDLAEVVTGRLPDVPVEAANELGAFTFVAERMIPGDPVPRFPKPTQLGASWLAPRPRSRESTRSGTRQHSQPWDVQA